MPYFNSNHTGLCETNEVIWQIGNLTASYSTGNNKELMKMASAPVIVFILVALFLGGVSFGFSAVLNPNYRLLLSSALGLSLPVMSYLFSEAKDAAAAAAADDDLSVRARVILTWMLALELLRKKVDEIRARGSYYSSTLQRAGRVAWLGSLIYFNITSPGRKAVFSVLWILCATKLVQRIVFTEVEKRSYPNKSWLISSYMAQIIHHAGGDNNKEEEEEEPILRCKYIVMGEEKLVGEVTAYGYKLNMADVDRAYADRSSGIITVGQVPDPKVRRVCLSFALFKLLRRRLEHLPEPTVEEAQDCRHLLMEGLIIMPPYEEEDNQVLLFQVMADEVRFLSDYYHSVVPVVLASPVFVLVNYFLVPVVVLGLCLVAVVACSGNGDVSYVLSRISTDNYALKPGFAKLAICTLARASHSRPAFFFMLDLSITALLFVIFFLEEIWELLVIVSSNWFVISMLCNYMARPHWRESPIISGAFRGIMWARRKMSKYTNIRLKQFHLLNHRRGLLLPFLKLSITSSVPATHELKQYIMGYVGGHYRGSTSGEMPCLSNGKQTLLSDKHRHNLHIHSDRLLWSAASDSLTEVILTWHVATCLLDTRIQRSRSRWKQDEAAAAAARKVATSLSQYCAYLVVFHPELLPDRRAKAELVLEDASKELKAMLGFWGYYLSSKLACYSRLIQAVSERTMMMYAAEEYDDRYGAGVVLKGAWIGRFLINRYDDDFVHGGRDIWELLADFWTELMVSAAPSSDEEHVNAHADILPQGVELITVLWAFAMHTGMKRPAPVPQQQQQQQQQPAF